jgi:hypothetical protein
VAITVAGGCRGTATVDGVSSSPIRDDQAKAADRDYETENQARHGFNPLPHVSNHAPDVQNPRPSGTSARYENWKTLSVSIPGHQAMPLPPAPGSRFAKVKTRDPTVILHATGSIAWSFVQSL